MSTSEESERRLAEALRAQATGLGRPGFVGRNPTSLQPPPTADASPAPAVAEPASSPDGRAEAPPGLWAALVGSRIALLLALLGGIVLGIALALLSLFAPGALPPVG